VPLATLDGMAERTVTINSLSKTFSVTGWRVGWAISPPALASGIRKVHDFLTVGAPAPLQEGVAAALEQLDDEFYRELAQGYQRRRDTLHSALAGAGFRCTPPEGAYYILADFSAVSDVADDTAFAVWLSREVGVTPVPGSSFFREGGGRSMVRFVFCKTDDVLAEAARRLAAIGSARPAGGGEREAAVRSGLQS
jgi:aspartate/methionine/tyrosine aminotransferase